MSPNYSPVSPQLGVDGAFGVYPAGGEELVLSQTRRPEARSTPGGPGFFVFITQEERVHTKGGSMSVSDELLQANAEYAKTFDRGNLPMPPGRRLAVVTC